MWKRTRAEPESSPDRIRLSVKEPPCRCREPLVADEAKRLGHEVAVDTDVMHPWRMVGEVVQYVDGLSNGQRLRVLSRSVPYPLLNALAASGCRWQIVARNGKGVEMLVWRFLTDSDRKRYLQENVSPETVVR